MGNNLLGVDFITMDEDIEPTPSEKVLRESNITIQERATRINKLFPSKDEFIKMLKEIYDK